MPRLTTGAKFFPVKTIIHVNQHNIRANKDGENRPVITCKTYKSNTYAHEAIIYGQDGKEAARIIYSPDKPLSCGAKVWIETSCEVEITTKNK
jgi:uncharacterized protein YabE (DUF348 family)